MQSETVKKYCTIRQSEGRYNLCSNEKQWCLSLVTHLGSINELFAEEQGFCYPSDVLDLIETKIKSFLWSSTKERDLAQIQELKKHIAELDILYQTDIVEELKRKLKNETTDLKGLYVKYCLEIPEALI